jgi:antitoxin CptB
MNAARPVRAFGVEVFMTGTSRSSDGLEIRRRKLLFRAWHRGMREMDLILGGFADTALMQLTEAEMAEFERLMECPDRAVLAWITGEEAVPAVHDGPLFRRLQNYHLNEAG